MPKVESSRTKSKSPTPPLSPHRVSIPISPTAAHRAHPIDSTGAQRSSPTSPRDRKRPKDDPTSSPTSTVPVSPAAPALAPAARAVNDVPSRPALATAGQTASASSADSSTKKPLDKATDAPKVDPIDMEIFSQILELDEDDEEQSFSKSIVNNYYDQVVTTFKDLRKAIEESNLPTLSNLGHFLKGSSAALGVRKVQATCEKIQNVGKQRSEDGSQPGAFTKDEAIKKITVLVERAEEEFDEGKAWFDKFYPGGLGEADT